MRPERILEADFGGTFRHDAGGEARRIHRLDRRRPDQVDAGFRQSRRVGIECARIAREVLVRGELRGIDEDRDHHAPRAPARQPDQRQVALMQRAHGRHERDVLARVAPARERAV